MKRRNQFLVVLFLLAFAVSACKQGNQPTSAPSSPFIGGTSGLVINFEADSPPPEVTDQAFPFKAIVRLSNEGETQVLKNDVEVKLVGFSASDFDNTAAPIVQPDLTRSSIDDDLRPKARDADGEILEGSTTFVEIPQTKMLQADAVTGNTEYTFRADVCYKYRTTSQARLCVLADLISIGGTELCNPNQAKSVFSSSSPVQVNNFRESVIGKDKVTFSFDIVHSGNGNIYQIGNKGSDTPDTTDDTNIPNCPRDDLTTRRVKLDKVTVTVDAGDLNSVTLEGTTTPKLDCNLEGEAPTTNAARTGSVRLIGGKRTVTCTLDLTNKHPSDFEKIANIYLDFNYDDNKETKVLVKHLLTS